MLNILEVDSVMKTYGDHAILTDIYLKCQTGDIIGMLGRNGTGKSTLLKIIFGTVSTNSKFVRINGKSYKDVYKIANEVCYLPQHNFLLRHLTVQQTVSSYLSKDDLEPFYDDALLKRLLKNRISALSGGELRYLEIKLILNLPTKFVLLDEPFNGVAPVIVSVLKQMILGASANKGIILTDHDYENVMDVANKYCLIYDGGIKHIATKQDLVRWNYLTATNSG